VALRVDDVDLVRDRALVERFQEGDPAAFETLYRRYFARLARFCQKRVGDPHEAEEIAQEAFARALRALPTFEGERRFYPWMTVIAARLCVDSHRRRGRSEPSSQIDLGVIEGGQEKIVDAVDIEILRTAMGSLAPRHREVLDLREQQGWSYQQIADHYGVSLGTVEALLFRARKALKREFMAVVGTDKGAWAALPVVGGVFGRAAMVKAKIEAWASGLVPALSGPAVAAALAVTAVTGAAVGGADLHGSGHDGAGRPTAIVRLGGAAPASVVSVPPSMPELLSGVPDNAQGVASGHGSAVEAPARPSTPGVSVPAAVDEAVPRTASPVHQDRPQSESRPIAAAQPVFVDNAVGYAGLDPQNVAQDVTSFVTQGVQP
jgi:RNA polymerase sigma-70 factor (ECF subfamily)